MPDIAYHLAQVLLIGVLCITVALVCIGWVALAASAYTLDALKRYGTLGAELELDRELAAGDGDQVALDRELAARPSARVGTLLEPQGTDLDALDALRAHRDRLRQ